LNQVVAADALDAAIDSWTQRLLQMSEAALEISKVQFRAYAAAMRHGDATAFEADLALTSLADEKAGKNFRSS
jgi:1,4-dihydroxy-2-naphthoyl-CoA synthase